MPMYPGPPPSAPLTARSEQPPVDAGGGDRLYRTMAAVLGIAEQSLTEGSSPDTIPAWDSLNHLNVIMAMEQEFGVELSPDDAMSMLDVSCIRSLLRSHGVEV
jgi:acyl carrier protein